MVGARRALKSNHTYVAIYFRKDTVLPVSPGTNDGTDEQGNPYFYLEFKNNKKNWFVVGAIPIMYYYHPDVKENATENADRSARKWAEELGKYAFNFLTDTKISFDVKNMYKVTTKYLTSSKTPSFLRGRLARKRWWLSHRRRSSLYCLIIINRSRWARTSRDPAM